MTPMEPELARALEIQDKKIDEIAYTLRRMRRYFFWTLVITIAMIILPLVGLVFVIPRFMAVYGAQFSL